VPPPSASRAPQPPPAARVLDPAEIDILVKQGQQFIAVGDFVQARFVFQRAAEAGSAMAALALGASYDPVVLERLGVRGVQADVSKARAWYQKAKDFGAPEAARRLDILANRGR
jgi:TPR repeat protein